MKIQLFATTFSENMRGENVGIGRITAYLKEKGVEPTTTYLGNEQISKCLEEVDTSVGIFGFSVYPANVYFFGQLASAIKKENRDAVIFFGSKMATTYYRRILRDSRFKDIDCVILGDGEETLLQLLNEMNNNRAGLNEFVKSHKHIASAGNYENKEPASLDINTLPYPDRSWIYANNYVGAFICDSHGCVGRCSFCCQVNYHKKWNGRSPEDVFHEMKTIYDSSSVRQFMFTGGSFEDPGELGKQKVRKLCQMIIDSGMELSMVSFLRADTFHDNSEDRNLLKLMHDAGLYQVIVGVESGNAEDLKLYNKRATVEDNKRTLRLLNEIGIYYGFFGFISFNPYSTIEKLQQNYQFLIDAKALFLYHYGSKLWLHYDTGMYDRTINDGLITEDSEFDYADGYVWKFMDPESEKMYRYIKDTTGDLAAISKQIEQEAASIDALIRLIPDNQSYVKEFEANMNRSAEILQDYFEPIFMKGNLCLPQSTIEKFKDSYVENAKTVHKHLARVTKAMYRRKIFK